MAVDARVYRLYILHLCSLSFKTVDADRSKVCLILNSRSSLHYPLVPELIKGQKNLVWGEENKILYGERNAGSSTSTSKRAVYNFFVHV